jgi:membrane protein YqaA with SNARE-associated domain
MDLLGDEDRSFLENRIFTYNHSRKVAFGVFLILGIALLISFTILYIGVWRHSDFLVVKMFNTAASSVTTNIADSTSLGVFYTGAIGGLFFIFMPMEVMLARFINSGSPFTYILLLYMAGILIAYSLNYFIGLKLSRLSKKLISPKKFYSIKGKVNKWGGVAIYVFNALPLPSQLLAAILGVFRYNKTRFYVYLLLGQLTKIAIVAVGVYKFS